MDNPIVGSKLSLPFSEGENRTNKKLDLKIDIVLNNKKEQGEMMKGFT